MTKVVLAGGEQSPGRPGAGLGGQAQEAGGWGPGLADPACTLGVAPALFRGMPAHFSDSAQTEACYHMLSRPQPPPDPLLLQRLPRPGSLVDKTQLHSRCSAPRPAPRAVSPCVWAPTPRVHTLPCILLTLNPHLLFLGLFYKCVLAPSPPPQCCTSPSAHPCLCHGPGGWTRHGASCSRASRLGTHSGCALSTTVFSTWIPR